MFSWLKQVFGLNKNVEVHPIEDVKPVVKEQAKPVAKPKTQAKKPAKITAKKVDYAAMSKKDLLALCNEKGIKANSSLKKDELITRLNG